MHIKYVHLLTLRNEIHNKGSPILMTMIYRNGLILTLKKKNWISSNLEVLCVLLSHFSSLCVFPLILISLIRVPSLIIWKCRNLSSSVLGVDLYWLSLDFNCCYICMYIESLLLRHTVCRTLIQCSINDKVGAERFIKWTKKREV